MSSRSLNRVMLVGNVGQEPRLASTNTGAPVCSFSVATNRSWLPRGATERREEVQWHQVVAFSGLADICSQILTKGTKVFILGRIKSNKFVNPEGLEIKRTEIIASQVIALDKRKGVQAPYSMAA